MPTKNTVLERFQERELVSSGVGRGPRKSYMLIFADRMLSGGNLMLPVSPPTVTFDVYHAPSIASWFRTQVDRHSEVHPRIVWWNVMDVLVYDGQCWRMGITVWCCCGCVLAPPFRSSHIKCTLPVLAATPLSGHVWLETLYQGDVFYAPPSISLGTLMHPSMGTSI